MKKVSIAIALLAACTPTPEPSGDADQVEAAESLRTWEQWVDDTNFKPNEEQKLMLAKGEALVGVVPEADLPIKHPNGTIEVPRPTYEKLEQGLSYRDIVDWVNEGLYDPTSQDQRKLFNQHYLGIDPTVEGDDGLQTSGYWLGDGSGSAPPPQPYKCHVKVALIVTATKDPASQSYGNTTTACGDYFGESAQKRTGEGAYKWVATITGNRTGTPWGAYCEETANNGDTAWAKVEGHLKEIDRVALDNGVCPNVYTTNVQVMGRANNYIEGHATVNFKSLGDIFLPSRSWGAKAGSEVKAEALDKVVVASGEVELASDCSNEGSANIGGKVTAKGVEGTANVGVGRVCKELPYSNNTLGICVEADSRKMQAFQLPAGGTSPTFKALTETRQTNAKARSAAPATGTFGWYEAYSSARMETKRWCAQLMAGSCGVTDIPSDRPNAGVYCTTSSQGDTSVSHGDCSTIY